MPLYTNAENVIREHLELVANGGRPHRVTIGELNASQLASLNADRVTRGFGPLNGLVFFRGKHIYERRMLCDGYTVEDIIMQIRSAFSEHSVTNFNPKMSSLRNPIEWQDQYGNRVKDEVVLECFANHPRAEIYSVIPKGDKIKPPRTPPKEG